MLGMQIGLGSGPRGLRVCLAVVLGLGLVGCAHLGKKPRPVDSGHFMDVWFGWSNAPLRYHRLYLRRDQTGLYGSLSASGEVEVLPVVWWDWVDRRLRGKFGAESGDDGPVGFQVRFVRNHYEMEVRVQGGQWGTKALMFRETKLVGALRLLMEHMDVSRADPAPQEGPQSGIGD